MFALGAKEGDISKELPVPVTTYVGDVLLMNEAS